MKLLVSSSVITFKEKAEKTWGLEEYKYPRDKHEPTCFFGMYHCGDYYHCLRHKGEKSVFWCGHDLVNLKNNRLPLYKMFREIDNYVENRVEQEDLEEFGICSFIRPSFLEDVPPVSYKHSDRPKVYVSGHAGREEEYGFKFIEKIAKQVPECFFALYGAEWKSNLTNVFCFGKVPPEQFNEEIKDYQCGLRLNEHDGFSEITAKSILMGQYPITRIKYPMIDSYETEEELIKLLKDLKNKKEPNIKAREFWLKNINQYPWTQKKF